ncbi:hypothetical protein Tco_0389941 [Tanacetum coccineum]
MATLIFSSNILPASRGRVLGPEIIAHSIGMILLLRNVTVPHSTGNFNIPCAMDGMARIFLILGLPIIPLCWDGEEQHEVQSCWKRNALRYLFSLARNIWSAAIMGFIPLESGVTIGGRALNFPFSKAKISFGVFVRSENLSGFRFQTVLFLNLLEGSGLCPLLVASMAMVPLPSYVLTWVGILVLGVENARIWVVKGLLSSQSNGRERDYPPDKCRPRDVAFLHCTSVPLLGETSGSDYQSVVDVTWFFLPRLVTGFGKVIASMPSSGLVAAGKLAVWIFEIGKGSSGFLDSSSFIALK